MSERLADETITKLSRRAGKALKVLKVNDSSVTVDRDGIHDKISIDRVTRAAPPLDPETLKPRTSSPDHDDSTVQPEGQKQEQPEADQQDTGGSSEPTPPPRRSERHVRKGDDKTDDKEYTIEKLVDHVPGPDGGDYKVRWFRFPPEDDWWLPAEEIPQHFRAAYHKRQEKESVKSERGQPSSARRGRRAKKGSK